MNLCWVTIDVSDMEKSIAFYQQVAGLVVKRRAKPAPTVDIVFMGSGDAARETGVGTELELFHDGGEATPRYGEDISLGFTVDSVERTMALLKSKGIAIHSGPFQPNPHLKFVFAQDPDGLKIQFVENL
jgi:lactoylglutathione lyase